jgi:hypothetical protein
MKTLKKLILSAAILAASSTAFAAPAPYSAPGHLNATTYTFTAAHTGNLSAYFVDSTAGYSSDLGLNINGVDSGVWGLNDHTSHYGQLLSFGNVHAGDSLVFKIHVNTTGDTFFSKASLNPDGGINHIYSSSYSGDSLIPAGTYVAFEDLFNGGDLNYHDLNFVFTNVATATPIPAAIWLFGTGIAGLVSASKRRKTSVAA